MNLTDQTTLATATPGFILSDTQMVNVVERVMGEREDYRNPESRPMVDTSNPHEELLGTTLVAFDARTGEADPKSARANYLLIHKECVFNIEGFVGHSVPERQFSGMLRAAIHQKVTQETQLYQPGDWVVVAWRLTRRLSRTKGRVKTGEPPDLGPVALAEHQRKVQEGTATWGDLQASDLVERPAPQLVLELALAEVSDTPVIDQWKLRTGKEEGSRFHYSQTQQLRHASRAEKGNRALAVKLIEEFYEFWGPTLGYSRVAIAADKLQDARDMVAMGMPEARVAQVLELDPAQLAEELAEAPQLTDTAPEAPPA